MSASINRISGMVSGIDTDSLVKKLITADSFNLNAMKRNQQKLTWQSTGYRQWNTDIFSFRSSTLFNMKLSSSYNTYSTASSNSDALSGNATADAVDGTYSYQVKNLAQSATMKSTVSNMDVTQALNASVTLNVTATDQTGTQHTATVSVATADKIGDVINKLNTAKDASGNSIGVKAIYDSTLKQFILKTKDTGALTQISLSSSGDTGDFLGTTLGFSGSKDPNYVNGFDWKGSAYVTAPTDSGNGDLTNPNIPRDAKINFNGTDVTSPTNSMKIMGVNYTLKNVTTGTNSVTVTRDIDTEVKNIKDFVSKYNDMLNKLNTAINEPVYKDYQPLTDDERTSMTDTQITQWEAKAKSGLFHSDSILKDLVNNMRNHMTSTVNNGSQYNSLSSIGIASQNYLDKGKLYVDETKLRDALQKDPDAVKNLFSQSSSTGQKGVVDQLYDDFQSSFKQLINKAGASGNALNDQSFLGKSLNQTNISIVTEQSRLDKKQNQYYAQFTAMESAMNKYNSQSAYLSKTLGQ